ncbi:MAG TPA: hypothetical protein VFQ91_09665, partial [Bryobacteraceae bacterium]|nr:hypothetical protein [Bryobacteraceae bacterium]
TVKMISTRLSDARLELTRGVALVEVADVAKDNAVTMLVKDAAVSFTKMGLIRIEAETGIRAYKGEVQVIAGDTPQILKEGREMQFANGNLIAKFDAKQGDPLYRWANRRAEYLAMANIASANMVQKSYNGGISGLGTGMWFFNSYYGMMTYLPGSGMYRSPYGYMYYSPARVIRYNQAYMPAPNNPGNGGFGGSGMGQGRAWNSDYGYNTTMGRSAGAVSMPAPSAGAPAAAVSAAPAGRGADVSTGRGGGGGRGR